MNEMGPYFEVGELRRTLETGFQAPERGLEALLHFSSGCEPCQRHLQELAHEDAVAVAPSVRGSQRFEAARLALHRLIDAERDPESADQLRPFHRYRLRNAFTESEGFSRLLLEESHRRASASPEVVKTALEVISEAWEPGQGDRSFHDLRGLALTYLGEQYRRHGNDHEACLCFRDASRQLAHVRLPAPRQTSSLAPAAAELREHEGQTRQGGGRRNQAAIPGDSQFADRAPSQLPASLGAVLLLCCQSPARLERGGNTNSTF